MDTKLELQPFLTGEAVPAPAWFERVIAVRPERSFVPVDGVDIELLTWGKVGNPGLLFLHGKGAHADWWSFIAPFFSENYRVAATSWSGMGRSGWRNSYPISVLAEEALAALDAGGLNAGNERPILVAHSFGSRVAARLCEMFPDRFRAVVLVDPPIFKEEALALRRSRWMQESGRPHRIYPSLEEALRRFRFSPEQPCDNLYIADYIARRSVTEIVADGQRGWRWCFDPQHRNAHRQDALEDLPHKKDIAYTIVLGDQSSLYRPEDVDYIKSVCGCDVPLISVPGAAHHVMVDQPLALVSVLRTIFACPDGGL